MSVQKRAEEKECVIWVLVLMEVKHALMLQGLTLTSSYPCLGYPTGANLGELPYARNRQLAGLIGGSCLPQGGVGVLIAVR